MFNRLKSVIGAVSGQVGVDISTYNPYYDNPEGLPPKFKYSRPAFLKLSEEEILMSADHAIRPIIHANEPLPFDAGYAECVNAGKSRWNEDQAVVQQGVLSIQQNFNGITNKKKVSIPYTYYGLFDGHGGVGSALCAANQLHHIVHEKLVDAQDDIWMELEDCVVLDNIQLDSLVTGALEASFLEMDQMIGTERKKYQPGGGCTALVALIIFNRLFVANSGDSRAGICSGNKFALCSMDFTPEHERERIRRLGYLKPSLLGKEFTVTEYAQPPQYNKLGRRIKYRDPYMSGWAYKTLQPNDLKKPIISGFGKRSRLMETIGVTRGFGDHDLRSISVHVPIKPFLSCRPEVQIFRLERMNEVSDVLVMATDGLWDVLSGAQVAQTVAKSMAAFAKRGRYMSAATCLVGAARGSIAREHTWLLKSSKMASLDDISVFVIPLLPYREMYKEVMASLVDTSPPNQGEGPDNNTNE